MSVGSDARVINPSQATSLKLQALGAHLESQLLLLKHCCRLLCRRAVRFVSLALLSTRTRISRPIDEIRLLAVTPTATDGRSSWSLLDALAH